MTRILFIYVPLLGTDIYYLPRGVYIGYRSAKLAKLWVRNFIYLRRIFEDNTYLNNEMKYRCIVSVCDVKLTVLLYDGEHGRYLLVIKTRFLNFCVCLLILANLRNDGMFLTGLCLANS